ncbi:MAG: hypothetical protein K2H09_04745, partial [Treponemataceae bacterium]|nr:hypothetical protein [Treponemataceae bacterium]
RGSRQKCFFHKNTPFLSIYKDFLIYQSLQRKLSFVSPVWEISVSAFRENSQTPLGTKICFRQPAVRLLFGM